LETITLTIDGLTVLGIKGQTILEVARENDMYIPSLCSHPRLKTTGSCRICVVDTGDADKLETSCTTYIREGMIIQTQNERVIESRRTVIELLLSQHNSNCMVCDKNGSCELQDLAYEMGIDPDTIPYRTDVEKLTMDDSNPAIIFDPNRCIVCSRCVSACGDLMHFNILKLSNNGVETKITTHNDKRLLEAGCISCGECVQVCPTGAIFDRMARFKGRWWELKKVETICPYCGVGCSIELYIKNGKIIKILGKEDGVENEGSLCVKGRFGHDWVTHRDRIKHPLIKRDGEFHKVTWDEALDYVTSRFIEIKEEHGPEALAGLASGKCTNEENYLFQKFVRVCFGNNNVDHCARLCHSPTTIALLNAFGSGAMTNSSKEFLNSDVIFIIGSNTSENHPVIAKHIREAVIVNGAKLLVADPRRINLVNNTTIWLRQNGGSDVALLNGLMNLIIKNGLQDQVFIDECCENYQELKKTVEKYDLKTVSEITGIPQYKLREAAKILGKAKRAAFIYGMGITQHVTGTHNVYSVANLAMLTGNVGRESTGVNPLRGQNNVQGACDLGALPNVYPGYARVDDPEAKVRFEKIWKVQLNPKGGMTSTRMVDAIEEGRLKGMYVMGENPLMSHPDLNHVRKVYNKLDFLVVQDLFMSQTAEMADVILPAVSFAEKDGTYTNTTRRIQRVRAGLKPIGESKPDWKIISELSTRMGYSMEYNHPSEIMDEIAGLVPTYGGVSYNRLEGDGLQWPCPNRDHPGTPFLHKDGFTRGKGKFHPVDFIPPNEQTNTEYPFVLNTGRILEHFHSGTMTRRTKVLNSLVPECLIEMNPVDANRLGIFEWDEIKVESRRGMIQARVNVSESSPQGSIFVPFHFAEAAANLLTNSALDPESRIPEFKVCAVKVEKIH